MLDNHAIAIVENTSIMGFVQTPHEVFVQHFMGVRFMTAEIYLLSVLLEPPTG